MHSKKHMRKPMSINFKIHNSYQNSSGSSYSLTFYIDIAKIFAFVAPSPPTSPSSSYSPLLWRCSKHTCCLEYRHSNAPAEVGLDAWLLLRRAAPHSVRLCWRGGWTNWESFNGIIYSTLLMELSMAEYNDNTVPPDQTSESG